jgi:hypothetical protein
MAVHEQFYLTCDCCANQYIGSGGDNYGETADEVRGIAVDDGWLCDVKVENGSYWDYCNKCKHKAETP